MSAEGKFITASAPKTEFDSVSICNLISISTPFGKVTGDGSKKSLGAAVALIAKIPLTKNKKKAVTIDRIMFNLIFIVSCL